MVQSMLMALSFLAALTITTGLECYNCRSTTGTSDPCFRLDNNVPTMQCPAPLGNSTSMCLSVTTEVEISGRSFSTVMRSCAEQPNNTNYCTVIHGVYVWPKLCYCHTDKCIFDDRLSGEPDSDDPSSRRVLL